MTITIRKRDGSTLIVGKTKPKGPIRFILEGQPVTLSEAARILDVGLRTIVRHAHKGVIDAAAIRALVPGEPLRIAKQEEPAAPTPIKAKRTPAPRQTYAFADSTLTLREWANVVEVPEATLRDRIEMHGWTIERALTTPSLPKGDTLANRNRRIIHRIACAFERAAA